MKAPEKIYVANNVFPTHVDWDGSPINTKRIDDSDIEYIQTDAFIEKACEWLKDNIYHRVYECGDRLGFPTAKFIEDFKNYMKEE